MLQYATVSITFLSFVSSVSASSGRRLSYTAIAGYYPGSSVTEHNAIDRDQNAMEAALKEAPVDWARATDIYNNGGFSKSYAKFTIPASATAIMAKTMVTGTTTEGEAVQGNVKSDVEIGDETISVVYASSETQAAVPSCAEGGLDSTDFISTKCFSPTNQLIANTPVTNTVIEPISMTTKAGRTLAGFSTGAEKKMYNGCPGCPYADYLMAYEYYKDFNYADTWVSGALAGTAVTYPNSPATIKPNADFATVNDDATRVEAAKKGSAYMNVWMYVIREFEDAIDDCTAGCIACNDKPVHAWDEGVAFYTGSIESANAVADNGGGGKMVYALADKRCKNFKTCGADSNSLTGTSYVNLELFRQFSLAQYELQMGQCSAVRPIVQKVSALMTVPLIQGTLRYAYPNERTSTKGKSEGATFAAALLPRIHHCNAADAATVYANMAIGAASTDFSEVQAAIRRNFECLNVTCAQVGGLYQSASSEYYEGAAPCVEPVSVPPAMVKTGLTDSEKTGVIVGSVFGGMAILLLGMCVLLMLFRERQGNPIFSKIDEKKEMA